LLFGGYLGQCEVGIMGEKVSVNASVESGTENLVRYGVQLGMLNRLLSLGLISPREHFKVKERLVADYGAAQSCRG
jgi:hypothetical protein